MPKKYLVTGAAGFIGAAVARKLVNLGNTVWTIDNLSSGCKENIPAGVVFIEGDCQDKNSLAALKDVSFDAILHIAGQSSGEISFEDPVYDLRTNTESTLLLIKYALKTRCERFIYASSMSVYGAVEDAPINETHACQPLSFYAVGKLASENYLRIYQSQGIKPTVLRLFNVYGAGQNMQNLKQGMVSIYLAQLLGEGDLIVKGALDRFRDLIYIDDVVDVFLTILENERSVGNIYNVGTSKKTTVAELIELLMRISGIDKEIKQVAGTPGDQRGIYGDITKIRNELGFVPRINLEAGLDKMIKWAKESN